jgi:hypothetical protein
MGDGERRQQSKGRVAGVIDQTSQKRTSGVRGSAVPILRVADDTPGAATAGYKGVYHS